MPDALKERTVRPFADFLQEQGNGALHDELSVHLNELIAAVQDTGKGGELTVKIKVKPAGKIAGTVVVTDAVVCKLPKAERGESLFFITKDFNLSRRDPNQMELDMRGPKLAALAPQEAQA